MFTALIVSYPMNNQLASTPDPDFWAPRPCLREPIPEIFQVAKLLNRAVDAHLAGEHGRAAGLIADANMPEVRDWVESLWGPASVQIHRVRTIEGAPPVLERNRRDPKKKPDAEQRWAIIRRDGYRCRFCGIPVIRTEIRNAIRRLYGKALPWGQKNTGQHAAFQCLWLQFNHVLPHSRGGRTDLD
ncbi:MAG: hypothetical protein OXF88_20810 [Rhodobacteraceae bacterium]|nr:hypothetical protein [Paracoccaceae bacterium]MCY4137564.1 hypothetical protein [Paracoccaceae bacterium]